MSLTRDKILAQAAIVRVQAEAFCIDEIQILRRTGEVVTDGESQILYAAPVSVRCRIINRSGASRTNVAAQFRATRQVFYDSTYRIQLPYGTEVSVNDQLVYTDKATDVQRIFEVVYVPPQHELTGAFIIGAEEVQ